MHVGNAHCRGPRVHPANILLDQFRLVTGGFYACRDGYECRHVLLPPPVHGSSPRMTKSDLPQSSCRRYTGIFAEMFMTARDDFDPLAPQREAAFFYGLFLRGHDIETLRQDIDVPRSMMEKWMKARDFEMCFQENLQRVYAYRKQVLAIF